MEGVKGLAVVILRRILDNAADAVSSAFPKGKQQGDYSLGAGSRWKLIPYELLNSSKRSA